MLARKQELSTQFQQLMDALLLAASLIAVYVLRFYSTAWFNLSEGIGPFREYQWLLVVIMPFGPLFLDLQGFYQAPLAKTKWKSFLQILRAMVYLSIVVSGCMIFLRLPMANRSFPLIFFPIATAVLLLKERIILNRLRRKALRGELRSECFSRECRRILPLLRNHFRPSRSCCSRWPRESTSKSSRFPT